MSGPATLYPRYIRPRVEEALADTPVVLLAGPRQAGKTTLARALAGKRRRFVTLDDPLMLLAAREDPAGLVRTLDRVVIDEVQRAPERRSSTRSSAGVFRRPLRATIRAAARRGRSST